MKPTMMTMPLMSMLLDHSSDGWCLARLVLMVCRDVEVCEDMEVFEDIEVCKDTKMRRCKTIEDTKMWKY